ncbi:hypothetical protein CI610_03344 [invertebrate metagenome]|uniref:Uncharacterized protein n=1 Tax=invertebrate metagenome TaxID=1711999 RepID=A0A2H9T3G2_9ZZZZ
MLISSDSASLYKFHTVYRYTASSWYTYNARPCLEQVIEHRYMQSFDFKTKFNNYRNYAVEEKEGTISSLALTRAI